MQNMLAEYACLKVITSSLAELKVQIGTWHVATPRCGTGVAMRDGAIN